MLPRVLPHGDQRQNWVGASRLRVEDARLVTGAGRFVDDLTPPGCLFLEFARAPMGAGMLRALDIAAATSVPGVRLVLTGADTASLGPAAVNPVLPGMTPPPYPILARDRVGAVGEALAAVIATSHAAARDGADAVLAVQESTPPEDRTLFRHEWRQGHIEAAFAAADHVVSVTVRHAKLAPSPLEPRATLAVVEAGVLTVWLGTQTPQRARADLAGILGLPESGVRVIVPDVGGAFGGKASLYPEDAVVALAALQLGAPVKWTSTRGEDLLAATHGRGATLAGELALSRDGRALALRARADFPLGHWMPFSGAVPARNAGRILPGPYAIDTLAVAIAGHRTASAPVGIYRGAGRPEAAMLLERLMDLGARALDLDPAEIRRRNLLRPEAFPVRTPTGETIDSGDYPALLTKAIRLAGYPLACATRDRRRRQGEVCGLGIGLYVEPCGQGWESARLALLADGRFQLDTGSSAQGQGRETAFAQIAADVLGVHPDRVLVRHGDTDHVRTGVGALASRSTAIGGGAVVKAAQALIDKARPLAAGLLGEAGTHFDGGMFRAPGRALAWERLAPLDVEVAFESAGEAWSSGCCIAAVAIDRDTGVPRVERIAWVDDAGTIVNPMLAEGQLHGGLAQGLGEALMERIVADADGQVLTGSFMDYALPRASDIPPVALASLATPSPLNPLGAKGVGEAGCIGVPAAIANAIADALSPFGVRHLDMPFTPETLWRAMQPNPEGGQP